MNNNNLTPSDFSIMVNNIPYGLENPEETLRDLFTNNAVPTNEKIEIAKIVLVYNIKEI